MEDGVAEAEAFLSGAESPEVLRRLGDDVREELDGQCAQRLSVGRHREEHPGVGVSGVLLNSGHLWRRVERGVAFCLARAALTLAEGLLEGFHYFRGLELGRQLLHYTVTICEIRKDYEQEIQKASKHLLAQITD